VVPGSWAYEQRGQSNGESDCDSNCRCQEDSSNEKDSSSTAGAAASPAAGASSLYPINTHGPPVDEGRESAPIDTFIKNLSTVSRSVSRLPLRIWTRSSVAFWPLANATTKATAAAFLSEQANIRLILLVRHSEKVALRTTTQVASAMIHLMTNGIWIWGGSSFLSPRAVSFGGKGLLTVSLGPLFVTLKAAVGVNSGPSGPVSKGKTTTQQPTRKRIKHQMSQSRGA